MPDDQDHAGTMRKTDLGNAPMGHHLHLQRKGKDAQETASCVRRFLPSLLKLGSVHTDKGVHQSVSVSAEDACHEYSSSSRNQQDRRRSCSRCERRNTDGEGSKWPSRRVVGLNDGMVLLLAERARQDLNVREIEMKSARRQKQLVRAVEESQRSA